MANKATRFILKGYDAEGREVFPEQEFLGDDQSDAASKVAAACKQMGADEGTERRKAATRATGSKTKKSGGKSR